VYGPKVICSREPIRDVALASRSVQISMVRSTDRVLPLGPDRFRWLADLLQPRLLKFRLRNYHRKLEMKVDLGGLSPRSRDLALALAGPLVDKPGLQKSIVRLILQREPDVQARHSDEREMLVLEGFFFCCHVRLLPYVLMGTVSEYLNKLLELRGEPRTFEARGVGPIVRQLGFFTERIGSAGIGVRLSQQVLSDLHKQARAYNIPISPLPAFGNCSMCVGLGYDRKAQES